MILRLFRGRALVASPSTRSLFFAALFLSPAMIAFAQSPPVILTNVPSQVPEGVVNGLLLYATTSNNSPITWRLEIGSRNIPLDIYESSLVADRMVGNARFGPLAKSDNGQRIALFATNAYGTSAVSGTLIVASVVPGFVIQPKSQTITEGSSALFDSLAGGAPLPTYQWKKDGVNLPGATLSYLNVFAARSSVAGTYQVVATNINGSASSNPVTLTVTPSGVIFLQQPQSQAVNAGGTVSFSVTTLGSTPITYQWKKDGASLAGATAATLTLASAQPGDAGSYQVVASNPVGSFTSSSATLTVIGSPLRFSQQPQPVSARVGSAATFTAVVAGTAPITYQWRKDGTAIAGATSATFTLPAVDASQAGSYSVVATNSIGSITSDAALLTVTSPPVLAQSPQSLEANLGGTATLQASATGTAPLSYQWQKDGVAITGATNANLTLRDVRASDAGVYSVIVTNPIGSVTSNEATLLISIPGQLVNLSILTSLQGPGDSFKLGVVLGGAGAVGTSPILVRAVGPSLSQFGLGTSALSDPKLELFSGATKAGENDDWAGLPAVSSAAAQVGAFPFASTTSKDAAHFAASLPLGDNSITISGNGNSSGMVLAEIYDVTARSALTSATPRIVNVSVLKAITGSLTAGFVIRGTTEVNVLIRAVGPSLAGFGVTGFVADPRMELQKGSTFAGANEDWGSTPGLDAAFAKVGAFPLAAGSKDAALLATLAPGDYTVQVSAAGPSSGLALVEIYEVR